MRYQLILQFPASSTVEYDSLVQIEDLLIDQLRAEEVDGHDAGFGEFNIFILTSDPQKSFARLKAILGKKSVWAQARVAYRELHGEQYTTLWPDNLTEFKVG